MPSVARIVCPVDFSETAQHAYAYALLLAKRLGAELTVLHVVEVTPLVQTYNGVPDIGLQGEVERSAREQMQKLLASGDCKGVKVISDIVQGPTYRTIVEYVAAAKADLVVIGTHGRSRLEYTFFGSVTERVMKSVACPVLVVRKPKSAEGGRKKKK